MPAGETFSVRLPPGTKRELEEYAQATKRSRAVIVKEAVEAHLTERRAYLAAIKQAEQEIDRGDTVEGQEVIAWLHSWGKADELPQLKQLDPGKLDRG